MLIKLYNTGKVEMPKDLEKMSRDLVMQQLNNQTCGGELQQCCVDCLLTRWQIMNTSPGCVFFCCCNCFCIEPIKFTQAFDNMFYIGIFIHISRMLTLNILMSQIDTKAMPIINEIILMALFTDFLSFGSSVA